jgi:TatA/E family protein of Tat protein translocase
MTTFLFISGGEIVIVVLVVLLLFGSKKIPELARTLGKGMNEFKRATDEIKREFREGTDSFTEDINQVRQSLNEEASSISETMNEEMKMDDFDPYGVEDNYDLPEDASGGPEVNTTRKKKSSQEEISPDIPETMPRERGIEDVIKDFDEESGGEVEESPDKSN